MMVEAMSNGSSVENCELLFVEGKKNGEFSLLQATRLIIGQFIWTHTNCGPDILVSDTRKGFDACSHLPEGQQIGIARVCYLSRQLQTEIPTTMVV